MRPAADAAREEDEEERVLARLEPRRKGGRTLQVVPPDEAEERVHEAWILAAARAARRGGSPPAAPPGFKIAVIPGQSAWLLSEGPERRGAGALVLRVGEAAPVLVEAPHTFFDQGTLQMAASTYAAQRARALLINTAHRYGGRP
ncbi:MAG: hypothetical protein IT372_24735, partial [Polyangiaceae bacterium]|nr:hypothetical protein [Polyangiaceae bacterium]